MAGLPGSPIPGLHGLGSSTTGLVSVSCGAALRHFPVNEATALLHYRFQGGRMMRIVLAASALAVTLVVAGCTAGESQDTAGSGGAGKAPPQSVPGQGAPAPGEAAPPAGLGPGAARSQTATSYLSTFALDVDTSGSMAEPGRLDLVKDALHTLIDQLRPSDRVAIVAYESEPRTVQRMISAAQKER